MLSVIFAGAQLYAQENPDSLRKAREQKLESTRIAQKRSSDSLQAIRSGKSDSTRAAQKNYLDSVRKVRETELNRVKTERKRISDSLAVIRAHKESKKYKDSVARVRQARLDSIQVVRQAKLDSIKQERKRVTDSIVLVRKATVDSIRTVQKKRSDSLAVIRSYRQSKRYKDSVEVVRKLKSDSIKFVRKTYYDSITTERKKINDSIAAVRTAYSDSITTSRKIYADSIKKIRKIKTDSLAKLKEKKEKEKVVKEKQKEDKTKLAIELKIKKKREAYNNDQMLKKRWGFPRSVFQNTFTKFNYYFNANQKMDEALDNMQRFRKENYDSLLAIFPFDPDRDSSVLSPDMDSIIQKASLGIQIHDPRTKWGDDLYLLLGQAYYYKGDYKNASDAFKYVVSLRDKKKKKNKRISKQGNSVVVEEKQGISKILSHRSVHNEAILWLARVYTQQHKEGEAESVLDLIQTDTNFSGSLSGRVALERSFIRLNQKDYRGAIEPLTEVANDNKMPDWVRMRAAYINGQLLQKYENYTASAENFSMVLDMHPKIDMDFYAKKNMATSLMLAGGAQEDAVAVLKKILKDGKYAQYYEQVYYLLGRLSINGKNPEEAIAYLKKGIDATKSTDEQKAKSYATLGDIYYDQRKYEDSKNAYDSASAYMGNAPDGDDMQTALRRSVALGNLTVPLRTIRHNDSLLVLSEMNEKEQKVVVRRYIKLLEDRRTDSIFQAENAGLTSALKNAGNSNNTNKNNYANWYFTNPALMQKGYNDFKQKWGSRPLADNWRRSSAGGGFAKAGNSQAEAEEIGKDANGIPTEESLLAAIPKDKADKDSVLLDIRLAYIAAANAYVKDLEDYPPAIGLLDTLDRRFPKHEFDAEVLYIRYIIALKQNRIEDAKKYSARLLDEFADTKWAKLVQPTEDGAGMDVQEEGVVAYYDKTYSLLIQREFAAVLPRAKEGQVRYQVPVYKDRFQIMEAISLAMLDNFGSADSVLTVFMTGHTDPNDSLRRWADAVLKYISDSRSVSSKLPGGTKQSTLGAVMGDSVDSTSAKTKSAISGNIPAEYKFDANEEHLVLFVFKLMEQRTKGVQVAIEDFNKFKFGSLALKTDVTMLNNIDGVIFVKSFTNRNQALIYMNSLKKTKQIFREYESSEYDVLMISASNYAKLITDKDIQGYTRFFKSKY